MHLNPNSIILLEPKFSVAYDIGSKNPTIPISQTPSRKPHPLWWGIVGLLFCIVGLPNIALAMDANECEKPSSNNSNSEVGTPHREQLASLLQSDGTCVHFYELEPGVVVVTAVGPISILAPSMKYPDLAAKNIVDLYQAMSNGESAPAALVEAQRRVDKAFQNALPEKTIAQSTVEEANTDEQSSARSLESATLSASDFSSTYCRSFYDFSHCHTNRTGDSSLIEERAHWVEFVANPYRGNIHMQLQTHNIWGWHDSIHEQVLEGQIGYAWGNTGSSIRWRANIHFASGDGYHWVFQGFR